MEGYIRDVETYPGFTEAHCGAKVVKKNIVIRFWQQYLTSPVKKFFTPNLDLKNYLQE
jgi:hypothetical protein